MNKSFTGHALNILVVEDDPSFALDLEMLIEELGHKLVSSVKNADEALKSIADTKPDLAIVDIYIKGVINGIQLAKEFRKVNIPIVFSTGLDDREIYEKAKQLNPVAYLIKPYNLITLEHAIESLKNRTTDEKEAPSEKESLKADVNHMFIKNRGKLDKVLFHDIDWVRSEGNYCIIHTTAKRYAMKIPLKKLLERFPEDQFHRIHRSYLIRLSAIQEVNLEQNSIRIKNESFPVGRTYRKALLSKLNTI